MPPTVNPKSVSSAQMAQKPELKWAANYCDEENHFVRCFAVTRKANDDAYLDLGRNISNVLQVIAAGKLLTKDRDYALVHSERVMTQEDIKPPITSPMSGMVYSDGLILKTKPASAPEVLVVLFKGYKQYHPTHR